MLLILDGFGSHVNSLPALQTYYDAKVLVLKEGADSSHVNQAYDRDVAKEDKKNMRWALNHLRSTMKYGVTLDQWALVNVGLAAVRELGKDTWLRSFSAVNLHPGTRKPFPEWIKTIQSRIEAGMEFKTETASECAVVYKILPPWWHGTPADENLSCARFFGPGPFIIATFRSKIISTVTSLLSIVNSDP